MAIATIPSCLTCSRPMSILHEGFTHKGQGFPICRNPECGKPAKEQTEMSTFTATKSETLPVGEYLAQITDYEESTGQFGPQVKFVYEVLKPDKYAGKAQWDWCPAKVTLGNRPSKLAGRVQAAIGRNIQIGENIDLDALVGRQVVFVMGPKQNDPETNTVIAVRAPKGQAAMAAVESDGSFQVGEPAIKGELLGPNEDDPFADPDPGSTPAAVGAAAGDSETF